MCCSHLLYVNAYVERTNSVDPDQTAPIGAVSSSSTVFVVETF